IENRPDQDCTTGGVIVGAKNHKKVYENGKGRIELRSRYKMENTRSKKVIVITEIPFNVKKSELVRQLDEVVASKKVTGLKKAADESRREGLRIVIECDKKADERVILSYLKKKIYRRILA